MNKLVLGVIEEGSLKGKKVIFSPRNGLKDNEFLVEQGVFMNGAPVFHKACLTKGCEKFIANRGCDTCN